MPKANQFRAEDARSGGIVLAGVGREGAAFVHGLGGLPDTVRKLFVTGSPTQALYASPDLVRIRGDGGWRGELQAALGGSRMVAVVAAAPGREEAFAPDLLALGRKAGALTVATLVEPLLSRSPHKSASAAELTKEVIRSADATMLFPAVFDSVGAMALSESLKNWTRRLSASVRGLLTAASTDNAMDMDFSDIAAVLSGHCRATVGAGVGRTIEAALRDAMKKSLVPLAETETAHSVFAHVIGDAKMPLDDARRILPILEHLFPKAEAGCGVAICEESDGIQATIIAGKLEARAARSTERKQVVQAESPFFKAGDPTVYDGENLDIPAFVRKEVHLPGGAARPVPAQQTLFEGSSSAPG